MWILPATLAAHHRAKGADMHSWDRRQRTPLWQIVLGVTLGVVVMGVGAFYARIWIIQHMFENMTEQVNQIQVKQQQAIEKAQARTRAELVERQRQAALKVEAQQAAEARLREEAARRERAWAKFYVKPSKCEYTANNETLVECANEHIRAKRRFEVEYAAGKL